MLLDHVGCVFMAFYGSYGRVGCGVYVDHLPGYYKTKEKQSEEFGGRSDDGEFEF